MRGPPAGPRVLLRRLREIMAEPISAQDRLDKIVAQIAANVVAEVCSVYVLRSDGVLELYATEGLKREAVHHAALRIGQGLVGTIAAEARPLNLPNAQSHPAFRYLPETGEEIYSSFLGVPILRAGRTLGVLVVQNKAHRTYYDEEVEALQTTAMVLAEMIAVGELEGLARPGTSLDLKRAIMLTGVGLGEGVGLGHVVLHEPRVVVTALIGEDADQESARLDAAIASLRLFVDDMLSRDDIAEKGEHRDVLEAYRMFAHDRGWVRRMHEAIRNGLTAEAAVEKVQSDTRATSPSSPGRSASPRSAAPPTSPRWSRTATRSSSTASPARCISGRRPTWRRPMRRRCASGQGARSSIGSCATSRRSPATAPASRSS